MIAPWRFVNRYVSELISRRWLRFEGLIRGCREVSKARGLDDQAVSRSGLFKKLSLILRIGVAVGAMAWVVRGLDWKQAFLHMNLGSFALSLAVFMFSQVLLAFRWWLLLWVQDIPMKVSMAIKLHLLGLFYNNVMPSSMGGDVLRAWYASKHTDKRLVAAMSVFVDRVVALVSMILMVLAVYLFLIRGHESSALATTGTHKEAMTGHLLRVGLAVGAVLLAFSCLALAIRPIRKVVLRNVSVARMHVLAAGRAARDSVRVYCGKPLVLVAAMGLTMFLQSIIIVSFWVLGRSLGVDASVRYYLIIFPITWLVSALPISIAGIGLLEGGVVVLFTALAGVGEDPAKALALCQRFVWVLASLPGGIIHLFGAHLPEVNSFDGKESEG
jgi:uncharacterized protein (TIRG00374 family)